MVRLSAILTKISSNKDGGDELPSFVKLHKFYPLNAIFIDLCVES